MTPCTCGCANLHLVIKESDAQFGLRLVEDNLHLSMDFGEVQRMQEVISPDGEVYDGSYDVVPKVEQQVLPTAQKIMKDDVTVRAIPVYEVSNTAGGITVYIAKETE